MTRDAVPHGPTSPLSDERPRTGTSGARGYAERQIAAEGRAAGPTEAARAAREALYAIPGSTYSFPDSAARTISRHALAAALPLIEARLRAEVAGDIDALRDRHFAQHGNEESGPRNYDWGLTHAANIARTGYPLGHP